MLFSSFLLFTTLQRHPIAQRIRTKVLSRTYKALLDLIPGCLVSLIWPHPTCSLHSHFLRCSRSPFSAPDLCICYFLFPAVFAWLSLTDLSSLFTSSRKLFPALLTRTNPPNIQSRNTVSSLIGLNTGVI